MLIVYLSATDRCGVDSASILKKYIKNEDPKKTLYFVVEINPPPRKIYVFVCVYMLNMSEEVNVHARKYMSDIYVPYRMLQRFRRLSRASSDTYKHVLATYISTNHLLCIS